MGEMPIDKEKAYLVTPMLILFRKRVNQKLLLGNILDAILIASEAVGDSKANKRKGFLLKLDYEKAYDQVD